MLRKFLTTALALVGAMLLAGCASTEGVADSAISTNLEIENIQNKTTLLNVVRASLRRPPVYQQFAQFNGTVRPAADLSLTVPFGLHVATANSAGLSLKGNEGPRIQSSPLDTQEFYQGIMMPIKMSTIDFYVQQGYPKALLFNLFFNRIELKRKGDVRAVPVVIRNYASADSDVDAFQMLVDHLIGLGLTTEPIVNAKSQFGDKRVADDVKDLQGIAAAATAGLSIGVAPKCPAHDADDPTKEKIDCVQPNQPTHFLITKSLPPNARFCFDPSYAARASGVVRTCPGKNSGETTLSLAFKDLRDVFSAIDSLCASEEREKPDQSKRKCEDGANMAKELCANFKTAGPQDCDKSLIDISFVIRSTDGVIYYLGEVARRKLYPDGDSEPRTLGYRREPKERPKQPAVPCLFEKKEGREKWTGVEKWNDAPNCQAIFWVDQPASGDEMVSIGYEGASFSVPGRRPVKEGDPPHPGGRSSQVLGIVAQLLALNKSAKDAPNTSIVNVVN